MYSTSAVQPNNVASIRNARPSSGQGTHTIVMNEDVNRPNDHPTHDSNPATLILRARPLAEIQRRQPRVQWQENVIDNEGLGRKKSKVCCIYNKPKAFDESSDESDHSNSDCCPSSRPSASRPCSSNQVTVRPTSHNEVQPSFTLPTPPRSPNAYEVEPNKTKGKGKA